VTQFLRLRHDRQTHEVISVLGTMNIIIIIIIIIITVVITFAALYCIWSPHPTRYVDIESEMWKYASMGS
jgi:hypothetical protein